MNFPSVHTLRVKVYYIKTDLTTNKLRGETQMFVTCSTFDRTRLHKRGRLYYLLPDIPLFDPIFGS